MQGIFVILYLLEVSLWLRIRKCETFRGFSKSRFYRYIPVCALGGAAIIAGVAFVADLQVKFRLTLLLIVIAPVVIVSVRNRIMYMNLFKHEVQHVYSLQNVSSAARISLTIRRVSWMIYTVFILMSILYLR
jgi:hypothetical protein